MHPKHVGRSVSWALHAITMYGTRQHFLVVLQSQISTILHHLRTFFSDDQGVYNNTFYVAYLILAKGPATMSSPLIFLKELSKSTRCLLFDLECRLFSPDDQISVLQMTKNLFHSNFDTPL